MKKLILISSIAVAIISACSSSKDGSKQSAFSLDTTKVEAGKTFYHCPMHLEVLSAEPGECPKCGMPLEKVVKK
jgi:hypothetical protein